jgi:hypothetical protein
MLREDLVSNNFYVLSECEYLVASRISLSSMARCVCDIFCSQN